MTIHSWLGNLFASRTIRKAPARCRLTLESLEGRLAPAIFSVTTLADGVPGSLRAALLASNVTAGPNTIDLTLPGIYKLILFGNAHDGTNGALQINNNSVSIDNTSGGAAIIDGGGVDRVFDIEGMIAGGVTFNGVTIRNGLAGTNSNITESGGGIYSPQTNVTLNNSIVTGNQAGSEGGGIWTNTGNVTLNHSTVTGNSVTGLGGGVYCNRGSISITSSTISGNSASGNAGGVGMGSAATGNLTISNSTITDNTASSDGGGIQMITGTASASFTLNNSTVSNNRAG